MTDSVVVTGSASGIGRGIAQRFTRAGWRVVGLDIRATDESIVADAVVGDVRDRSVHQAAARAAERMAPLTAWVNCAGIAEQQSVHLAKADHVERVIAVNLVGTLWGCAVAVEAMLERGGAIVNIGSTQAVRGSDGYPAYAASKGGVLGLTTQVAAEYAQSGIRCNAILPGVIETEMNATILAEATDPVRLKASWQALAPIGRLGAPADVAGVALFLAGSDSSFITGAAIPVEGGQLVAPPNWAFKTEERGD